jgi:uncharacterized membrane protein
MDAEDGHGTLIHAVLSYLPPSGGYVKSKLASLFSPVFEKLVRNDLNGFKHYIEEGRERRVNSWSESQNFGQTEI